MPKLLVIDDNENNRILLLRRLKPRGHEVLMAEDAETGIALAREQQPQLIFMDVGLPGMDGWQASRALKSAAETRHIAIIALTAHALPGDQEKARAALCDDYESKPINFPILFAKMEALLARQAGAAAPAPPTPAATA